MKHQNSKNHQKYVTSSCIDQNNNPSNKKLQMKIMIMKLSIDTKDSQKY